MAFNASELSFFSFLSSLVLLLLSFSTATASAAAQSTTSSYIIFTNNHTRPPHFPTQDAWYSAILQSVSATAAAAAATTSNSDRNSRMIYTYSTVMHGFAATLTPEEAELVSRVPGVIAVHKDVAYHLCTTRTPDFLGLSDSFGLWPEVEFGDGVVVGLVDTGIWPESKSFDDDGLLPIGGGWKGECEEGEQFNSTSCNNKLVGARFFMAGRNAMAEKSKVRASEYRSPRDAHSHGTHTSSTAAGSPVPGANFFGWANGTARGIAPKARIAMYKACWDDAGCPSSDILAAMEKAIEDGVHVLSLSLGQYPEPPYHSNIIAVGALAAVRRGIFVAAATGNSGDMLATASNTAPWITTVTAGTLDRKFRGHVRLGNGDVYVGESFSTQTDNGTVAFPLVGVEECSFLRLPDVRGKIVACHHGAPDVNMVQSAGGRGLIVINDGNDRNIFMHVSKLPVLEVRLEDGEKILSYSKRSLMPTVAFDITGGSPVGENRAPKVASFSSRGPSAVLPEILKPDVLAPGVNVLAAWPRGIPLRVGAGAFPSVRTSFNVQSGTSMACPHVAGVAALLKKAHPSWSPAMIRSAMMTTAASLDNRRRPIVEARDRWAPATPLAYGAGHLSPQMAMDPGLVYDAGIHDYVNLLCTLNYTAEQLRVFLIETPLACTKLEGGPGGLNYPSFSLIFDDHYARGRVKTLKRTLTMVSEVQPETYSVRVVNQRADLVDIAVEPTVLVFEKLYEKRTYTVTFTSKRAAGLKTTTPPRKNKVMKDWQDAMIIWESAEHGVMSPVVFAWLEEEA